MNNTKFKNQQNQPVVYQAKNGAIELQGDFKKETIWASQMQIVDVFGIDQSVVSRHINNVFKDGEINKKSNMQKMHIANSDKPVVFYSLDVILAIGYRTNSVRAINFRKWATKILKEYLLQGYAINEKRLAEVKNKFQELQTTISFLQRQAEKKQLKGQEKEILHLLADYSKTLSLLEKYDKNKFKKLKGKKTKFVLKYKECLEIIACLKKELITKKEAGDIFGMERSGAFESIANNLYQTFGGKELYKNLEEKSAHLLYLTIKDHSFSDGNKRIGSFLFVYFLDKNDYLYRKNGEKKINDNALTALALLIAESNPKEKDVLIKIIINLLND